MSKCHQGLILDMSILDVHVHVYVFADGIVSNYSGGIS